MDASSESAVLVLEALAKQRDMAVALAQLAAFACRMDISGNLGSALHLHEVAYWALCVVGRTAAVSTPALCHAAEDVAVDLAGAVLKMQSVQAAARQAATAAAVLASPGQGGLPADSVGRLRIRAGQLAVAVQYLVTSVSTLIARRRDRAMAEALLTALCESRLLQHTGRLLMLLHPGPGGPPAEDALVGAQHTAHVHLCRVVTQLQAMAEAAGVSASLELRPLLGVCGLHALLTLGSSTQAAADGGHCALAQGPLMPGLASMPEGPFSRLIGERIDGFMHALSADHASPAPLLPARARIRLLVRLLHLAGAASRALWASLEVTPQGTLRVDLSWSGGRRRSSQEFACLLPPLVIGAAAAFAVRELTSASAVSGRAWAAEAGSALVPLLTGARHCLEGLTGDADAGVRSALLGTAEQLLSSVTADLPLDKASRQHAARRLPLEGLAQALATHPAALPPPFVAALEGGLVPLLETLCRAAGDDPAGPEARLVGHLLLAENDSARLPWNLALSPPRQAASFLATLTKLLKRTPPQALLDPAWPDDGPLPRGVWLHVADSLLLFMARAIGVGPQPAGPQPAGPQPAGPEPGGPVDPSAPFSPCFVLAIAALQLLPVVSRLARQAVLLLPAERSTTDIDDTLLAALVGQITAAVSVALHLTGGGDRVAPTRVTAAVCLPFLVEEVEAVPLLGALLAALLRDGELPGERTSLPDLLCPLAVCCVDLAYAYLAQVGDGGGISGAGGSSVSAITSWSPAALRLLASRLRGRKPEQCMPLEVLAARLEQLQAGGALLRGSPQAAELAAAAERLAVLRAEVRAVMPSACSNPACVSLAGDSEAGLRLQQCGQCKRASYCCRECQVAHWKLGHKEACGGGGAKA